MTVLWAAVARRVTFLGGRVKLRVTFLKGKNLLKPAWMLDWEMLRRFKIERGVFFSEIGKAFQQAQHHDAKFKRKKTPVQYYFLKL
jgi:hypothetical protein